MHLYVPVCTLICAYILIYMYIYMFIGMFWLAFIFCPTSYTI